MNSAAPRKSSLLAKIILLALGVVVVAFLWVSFRPRPVVTKMVLGSHAYLLPVGYIVSALENDKNNRYYCQTSLPDISPARTRDVRDATFVVFEIVHNNTEINKFYRKHEKSSIDPELKIVFEDQNFREYKDTIKGHVIWTKVNAVNNLTSIECASDVSNPTCQAFGYFGDSSSMFIRLTQRPPEQIETIFDQITMFIEQHEVPQ